MHHPQWLGAPVTVAGVLGNLVPVTLGNTLGGFLFAATGSSYLYGALGGKQHA